MRVLGDRALIVLDGLIKEKGGIYLPEQLEETNQWGRVAHAGPDCVDVKDGDRVMVGAHSGTRVRRGGDSCVIIREGDIVCLEE